MRLLHAGADLLGGFRAGGNQGWRAQPREREPDGCAADHQHGNARTHERQHLPLRRLFEHRRGHGRSRGEPFMKPFTYERATSVADAAAKAASTPDAKFIAGGTNLLDLMKLQIEASAHL